MEVVRFTDQVARVAELHGRSEGEQRRRDAGPDPIDRWLAVEDGNVIACVTARLRPDNRMFLVPAGTPDAVAGLAAEVRLLLNRPVFMGVDGTDAEMCAALTAVGFEIEDVTESFEIAFDSVLPVLAHSKRTSGYTILSAIEADEARLFALDNAIRDLVPGTEGWSGNHEWFREELAESPPFDPAAYLVAVEEATDDYVGLVRIWRNPGGPRLGLLGVLPDHRSTSVAVMLLRPALEAAATWGWDTWKTETSLDNRVLHPRMRRYGAVGLGTSIQFVRR